MLKASDVWFHPSPRLAKPVTVGHAGGCGKVQFDALSFKLGPWWERLLWPTKMWGLFTWTPCSCKDLGHPWSNCHKNGNTSAQLEDWMRALNRKKTCTVDGLATGASCHYPTDTPNKHINHPTETMVDVGDLHTKHLFGTTGTGCFVGMGC